jgi:hypothetical protein
MAFLWPFIYLFLKIEKCVYILEPYVLKITVINFKNHFDNHNFKNHFDNHWGLFVFLISAQHWFEPRIWGIVIT